MLRSACLVLAVALVGCGPSRATLEVQLLTDYAPVRDFDEIVTTVEGVAVPVSTSAASDRSYGRATRVARFESLPPGSARITIALTLAGRVVQTQPRVVDLRAGQTTVTTLSITRDCEGVLCPDASPRAVACLGGRCIDPACSAEHPELCESTCTPACAASPIACVARTCSVEGVCIDAADDTACGDGEICIANTGCRAPFTGPEDAGVGDASSPDAFAGDAGAGDAGPRSLTLEEFGAGLARASCENVSFCLGPLVDDLTVDACTEAITRTILAIALPRAREAEVLGTLVYDGTFAEACLAAYFASDCSFSGSGYPTVCENALQGRVPVGGACSDRLECQGDAYCEPMAGGSMCPAGICTARGSLGATCVRRAEYPDEACERGAHCVSGLCTLPRATGAVCTSIEQCAAGDFCVGTPGALRCTPRADVYGGVEGSVCAPLLGRLCEPGLSCTTVCTAPVAAGAPCVVGTPDMCPTDFYCPAAGMLVCTPLPLAGEPCLPAGRTLRCRGGLTCTSDGLCHSLLANGEPCASADHCASTRCEGMVCVAPALCTP